MTELAPLGPTTASSFAVSPDDERIAVALADVAKSPVVTDIYVEDLRGGGHHIDLGSFTGATLGLQPPGQTAVWLMGWHQGNLVAAVTLACWSGQLGPPGPLEWLVLDPITGAIVATIGRGCGALSRVPSPAGVGCIDTNGVLTSFDWSGNTLGSGAVLPATTGPIISPDGTGALAVTDTGYYGEHPAVTVFIRFGQGGQFQFPSIWPGGWGREGCGWIDEDHALFPDGIYTVPPISSSASIARTNANYTVLQRGGWCAGRFPGAL